MKEIKVCVEIGKNLASVLKVMVDKVPTANAFVGFYDLNYLQIKDIIVKSITAVVQKEVER